MTAVRGGRVVASAAVVLAALLLAAAGLVVWASGRGFDVTDESYYLLAVRDRLVAHTSFGALAGSVIDEPTLRGLRFARLALAAAACAAFAGGLRAWIGAAFRGAPAAPAARLVVPLFACTGAVLAWSNYPMALSYNSIADAIMLAGSGAVLAALARPEDGRRAAWAAAAAGAAAALMFFVKFPSAVAFAVASAGALWAGTECRRLPVVLAGLGGAAAGAAVFFGAAAPPAAWERGFSDYLRLARMATHRGDKLVETALADAERIGLSLVTEYFLALVVSVTAWIAVRQNRGVSRGLATAAVAVTVITCVVVSGHWRSGRSGAAAAARPHLAMLFLLAGAWVQCRRVLPQPATAAADEPGAPVRTRRWPALAYLALLPPSLVAGTDNVPTTQVLQHAVPWFAVAGVALFACIERAGAPASLASVLCVPAALAGAQCVHGLVFEPYRIDAPLPAQTVPVADVPALRGVSVSPGTARFLRELRDLAVNECGYRPGDPVLVLHELPGAVVALGATVPPGAYFTFGAETRRNAGLLALGPRETLLRSVLILDRRRRREARTALAANGVHLDEAFEPVGSVEGPLDTQWFDVFRPRRL